MKTLNKVCWGSVIALLGAGIVGAEGERGARQDFSAREILARMARAYAECDSYLDEGVVTTVFIDDDRTWTTERPFSTALVRPDRFRFEYSEREPGFLRLEYIVWRDGREVRSWFHATPGVEEVSSLSLALAGATGVSGGSAHTIPHLLMPDQLGGSSLAYLRDPELLETTDLDGFECYRIRSVSADSPEVLWIDKSSYLVRRIDEATEFDDFRTEKVTTYRPQINGPIADELLAFDPPSDSELIVRDTGLSSYEGLNSVLIIVGSSVALGLIVGALVILRLFLRARPAKALGDRAGFSWEEAPPEDDEPS